MGCKVILTPQALDDLEISVTFIARDNPERARAFGNKLIDRALSSATFPEFGRVVPEVGEPTVRELIHGSYRIIYEIFPDRKTIYVLRFWHRALGESGITPTA
jgi:plasmid stabilization system protein ParE